MAQGKKSFIFILGLGVLVLIGSLILSSQMAKTAQKIKSEKESLKSQIENYNITVRVKPYQFGKMRECKGMWKPGLTVLDVLKECDKVANLGLKTCYEPIFHKSELVDQMLGLRYYPKMNRAWIYFVNNEFPPTEQMYNDPERVFEGKKPGVFPNQFYLKPGDVVEWRYIERGALKPAVDKLVAMGRGEEERTVCEWYPIIKGILEEIRKSATSTTSTQRSTK